MVQPTQGPEHVPVLYKCSLEMGLYLYLVLHVSIFVNESWKLGNCWNLCVHPGVQVVYPPYPYYDKLGFVASFKQYTLNN